MVGEFFEYQHSHMDEIALKLYTCTTFLIISPLKWLKLSIMVGEILE